ncbi:hypothetical protein M5K25_017394 [Dendrobium thyrsiflorum]|uniref:Uncharacterized protein n=1 Tax=Dendrobium thyrsiflorum TaxID=117978 RepID=A0ABD0UUD9_DENTH
MVLAAVTVPVAELLVEVEGAEAPAGDMDPPESNMALAMALAMVTMALVMAEGAAADQVVAMVACRSTVEGRVAVEESEVVVGTVPVAIMELAMVAEEEAEGEVVMEPAAITVLAMEVEEGPVGEADMELEAITVSVTGVEEGPVREAGTAPVETMAEAMEAEVVMAAVAEADMEGKMEVEMEVEEAQVAVVGMVVVPAANMEVGTVVGVGAVVEGDMELEEIMEQVMAAVAAPEVELVVADTVVPAAADLAGAMVAAGAADMGLLRNTHHEFIKCAD